MIVPRYTHAITSSNLQCDGYHGDTDVLMAIAVSSSLASLMVRVKYLRDPSYYRILLLQWRRMTARKAHRRGWHLNTDLVAKLSLDYWIGDQCQACQGTGFPVLSGIPTRSPKACHYCDGSGRAPLACNWRFRDPVLDLYQDLLDIFDKANARAMKKLRTPI